MTDSDRLAMRAWLDQARKVGEWPASLDGDREKFVAVYEKLVALVEDGQEESHDRRIQAR
jgi:hypothetical protein